MMAAALEFCRSSRGIEGPGEGRWPGGRTMTAERARKRKAVGLSVIRWGHQLWAPSAVSDVVKESRLKVGRRAPARSDQNVVGGWFHQGRIKVIEKFFERTGAAQNIKVGLMWLIQASGPEERIGGHFVCNRLSEKGISNRKWWWCH